MRDYSASRRCHGIIAVLITPDEPPMSVTGHCLCKRIRFRFDGSVNWCSHCHCDSCRRQTASPFTTFVSVARNHFQWESDEPAAYASSRGVVRRFCRDCGTPVSYENDQYPDEIHLYRALLELASTSMLPEKHDFWDERVAWVEVVDALPKE